MTGAPAQLVADMAARARSAATRLATANTAAKAEAVRAVAEAVRADTDTIVQASARDLADNPELSEALRDRLHLDRGRVLAIADAADTLAALDDPVGEIIKSWSQPNGLRFAQVRVPIGVIGMIYESRPNVTVDAGLLCLMSGNAVILRGGSEAVNANRALNAAMIRGIEGAGLPADAVQLVPTQDRAAVGAMLSAAGQIDMIVPRGGKALVARVQEEARVPVLAHLDGICHIYVDCAADLAMAKRIVLDAKMRRPGICGAMETLLIDRRAVDMAPALIRMLLDENCDVRGDIGVQGMDRRVVPATAEDWDTEYLAPIVSARLVDGVDEAIRHIAAHGSHHTDAIVTGDETTARIFLDKVDSAIVIHNASTQFADGGEFGFGAEIGIATGRLHARGPVALEGLTTYKTLVRGEGQVRA
ncbi:MAG: glutamate-5-semialdehyde dehydrogenase [Pseudomonadota bacterium]